MVPESPGALEAAALQGANNVGQLNPAQQDTADFADAGTNPGNLRADYVLPSRGLRVLDSAVFWPVVEDPLFRLTGTFVPGQPLPSSDHRLVWVDVKLHHH